MAKKWSGAFKLDQSAWLFDNFSFLIYLCVLGITYIANAHYAEKNVRKIQLMQREIKELKWEYTEVKSRTMQRILQSRLSSEVGALSPDPLGPIGIIAK